MIRKIFQKNKIRNANFFVEPDEIFLDSKNLQNFDQQQFEGRIEKPISKKNIWMLGIVFMVTIIVFGTRLGYLQIAKGESYFNRSENNILEKNIIFADRGIIYDRNKVELAWNKKKEDAPVQDAEISSDSTTDTEDSEKKKVNFPTRMYLGPGFSHILGYVSYPAKDGNGNFWQSEYIGKDGLEKEYNDQIKGENGSFIVETDAFKKVHSENIVNSPERGKDLVTTLDSRLQKELFNLIKNLSGQSFNGGSGMIMDVNTGEILTSTSYPEYDSEILSDGSDATTIKSYMTDKRKVFLDRNISGLYTPGSIIKPFLALGALEEGIIDQYKKIFSSGQIAIPNPYDPTKETVFKDWKAHGWTDMQQAIAVSSDVYFYSIGGGFGDQKGLGIANIEKYTELFGIGQATGTDLPDEKGGTIPSPEWKSKVFKGDPWRIGDTYHTAIGQYGFQVTPIEMTRAVAAIANGGSLVSPHYILSNEAAANKKEKVDIKSEFFDIVRGGMRMAVTNGTAVAMNVPYVEVAAKTGTAQIGVGNSKVNSWVMGFFPYDHPKYAFTVMMEAGPTVSSVSASTIMRGLLDWMNQNTPEYFGNPAVNN